MLRFTCAVLLGAILISAVLFARPNPSACASSVAADDDQGTKENKSPLLNRQDYERIAELIAQLPPWSKEEIATEDWKRVAELASALQALKPRDVEIALLLFMSKVTKDSDHPMDGNDSWTKPLLLLSVMFDKSAPNSDPRYNQVVRERYGVQICGGFGWKVIADLKPENDLLQLPVRWTDNGPELLASRVTGHAQIGGAPTAPYQPHLEYQAFVQIYPFRLDFRPLLENRVESWQWLWKQWIYEKADPRRQKQLRYKFRDLE